ncbi:hypothetical protein [Nocardia sp. NPDC019302]|uniref:hypothetical protein n=1 Tax=Nocardia sp. NPDC019302 TaxID=3154592 RepID=UPI0033CCDA2A
MSESNPVPHTTVLFTPNVPFARMQEAMRVAEMVSRLPDAIFAPDLEPLMHHAAIECFFVHVRGLIEFLGLKVPKQSEFSAADVHPTWVPPTDPARHARLQADWLNASRHVMHFSKERVKSETGPAVDVPADEASLRRMADDVLFVWDELSDQIGDQGFCPKRANLSLWA